MHDETRRQQEVRARGVFEQSSTAMVVVDCGGGVVDSNHAAGEVWHHETTLSGASLFDWIDSSHAPRLASALATVSRSGRGLVLEALTRTESVPYTFRIDPLTIEGKSLLLVTVPRSSSEVDRVAERSLMQAPSVESLGRMAAGVAHSFNNILMAALPWADLLRRKYPADAFISTASDHIRSAIFRASDVTRQLLDFAQPKTAARTTVDLAALAHQQAEIFRASLHPSIAIHVNAAAVTAFVDRGQIVQALTNLVLNGQEAMPNGGSIKISVREVSAEEQRSWRVPAARFVLLQVSDDGEGLTDEVRSRMFDPFFTTKDMAGGSGLGLAVVHRLIAENGGLIEIDTSHGGGTRINLLLPRSAVIREGDDEAKADRERPQRPRLILLVDDDEVIGEGIALLLEEEGTQVIFHPHASAALATIDRGTIPDLAVLDISMPGMRGDELHREIRKRLPSLPIVISSGYQHHDALHALADDQFTRFRQKPYDVEKLFDDYANILAQLDSR